MCLYSDQKHISLPLYMRIKQPDAAKDIKANWLTETSSMMSFFC